MTSLTEIDIQEDTYRPVSIHCGQKELVPVAQPEFQDEHYARLRNSCMERGSQEGISSASWIIEYMKEHLEQQGQHIPLLWRCGTSTGSDARETIPGILYQQRALGRMCMSRTDVTDVVRKEQRQKEELAAGAGGRGAGECRQDLISFPG